MGSPAIFKGTRTQLLTSKGLALKNGHVIDYDGPKNYLGNHSFEIAGVTGWSSFSTTLTSKIPTGAITTPSAKITPATTTTNPLAGTKSVQISCDNSTAGHGIISDAFTIDREDVGRALGVEFAYEITAGSANMTFASDTTATLGVFLYNVTAGTWIVPAGFTPVLSTIPDRTKGISFQTSGDTSHTQYRLAIVVMNSPASTGFTINFDRFFCGPHIKSFGSIVTDPVAYTPTFTGFGTVSGVNFVSWRSGPYLNIQGTFTTGTTTATEARISLGYNGVDGAVTSSSAYPTVQKVGDGDLGGSGSATYFKNVSVLVEASKTYLVFGVHASGVDATAKTTGSAGFGNSLVFTFHARVRIEGWSSNTALSDSADTRVVSAMAVQGGTTSITTSWTQVVFNTERHDTHNAFASNVFTAPIAGYYEFAASLRYSGNTATGNQGHNLGFYKNGSFYDYLDHGYTYPSGATPGGMSGTYILWLNPGDTIGIWAHNTIDSINSSGSIFSIKRLSGPQQIAATETVAMRAYLSANQTGINTNASYVKINYDTIDFDSHGCWDTTNKKWTCKVAGKYAIYADALMAATNILSNIYCLAVNKNGSTVKNGPYRMASAGVAIGADVFVELNLVPGDYIEIYIYGQGNNSASTISAGGGNINLSNVIIERVGN